MYPFLLPVDLPKIFASSYFHVLIFRFWWLCF